MKWAALHVALLVFVLIAGSSACAMTCSSTPCDDRAPAPPCHQKHGVKTCDHVLPVSDVAVAPAGPAPDSMGLPYRPDQHANAPQPVWPVVARHIYASIPILRI